MAHSSKQNNGAGSVPMNAQPQSLRPAVQRPSIMISQAPGHGHAAPAEGMDADVEGAAASNGHHRTSPDAIRGGGRGRLTGGPPSGRPGRSPSNEAPPQPAPPAAVEGEAVGVTTIGPADGAGKLGIPGNDAAAARWKSVAENLGANGLINRIRRQSHNLSVSTYQFNPAYGAGGAAGGVQLYMNLVNDGGRQQQQQQNSRRFSEMNGAAANNAASSSGNVNGASASGGKKKVEKRFQSISHSREINASQMKMLNLLAEKAAAGGTIIEEEEEGVAATAAGAPEDSQRHSMNRELTFAPQQTSSNNTPVIMPVIRSSGGGAIAGGGGGGGLSPSGPTTNKANVRSSSTLSNRPSLNSLKPVSKHSINAIGGSKGPFQTVQPAAPPTSSSSSSCMQCGKEAIQLTRIQQLEQQIAQRDRDMEQIEARTDQLQLEVDRMRQLEEDERVRIREQQEREKEREQQQQQQQIRQKSGQDAPEAAETAGSGEENAKIRALEQQLEQSRLEMEQTRKRYETRLVEQQEEAQRRISVLKQKVADSFSGNSWERQQQIESLMANLSKSQTECEEMRVKLRTALLKSEMNTAKINELQSRIAELEQQQCFNCIELTSQLVATQKLIAQNAT